MKTAVPAPAAIRTEESDVLPALGPDNDVQPMGLADFVFGLPVGQQIIGALVECPPVYASDAIDH